MTEPTIHVVIDHLPCGAIPVYKSFEPETAIWLNKKQDAYQINTKPQIYLPEIELNSTVQPISSPGSVQDQTLTHVKEMITHFPDHEELTLLLAVRTYWVIPDPVPLHVFQGCIAMTSLPFKKLPDRTTIDKFFFLPESFTFSNLENELMIWDILT